MNSLSPQPPLTNHLATQCSWQQIATEKSLSVKICYFDDMLTSYPEIRDRIYMLARQRDLRVDWIESTRRYRDLLLYDSGQAVVARATVPVRHVDLDDLAKLTHDLDGVFGEGWMD
jgi:hypothetical protein